MVFDILVNPKKVSGKPWEMYFIGILYALLAVSLSYWVFKDHSSLVMVALTAMASVPFIHSAIMLEEKNELAKNVFNEFNILREHYKLLNILIFLFLGFVTVFTLLYVLLPSGVVESMFHVQTETIIKIHSTPTGNFISHMEPLGMILINNLKVMFFCLIFSFFYGVGAIFIISWNASVMGAAIGHAIRQGTGSTFGESLNIIFMNLTGYFAHGIPEIASYFLVGLAGGIFSVALMKEEFMGKKFKKILVDCLSLLTLALVLLLFSALIEIFISPNLLA